MSSEYAWWNLSKKRRAELNRMRQAGMFGGTPGRAPYFWVLEGTMNPEGAAKSGQTPNRPSHWLDKAIEDNVDFMANSIARAIGGN